MNLPETSSRQGDVACFHGDDLADAQARAVARIAFWLLFYSALATIAGFIIAALWGAAPTGIIAFALILWGLRGKSAPTAG